MLAQVSDAVIAVDTEDRIVYLNAAAERLYGLAAFQALGQTLSKLYVSRWLRPEDEIAAIIALRERGEWRGDSIHVRQAGAELHVEASITVLREISGEPAGMLSVIRDVTERRQTEEHVKLLMAEVNHRAKNLLAVVQAVSQFTSRHGDPATFVKRLSDRIGGLAAGQDLLVTSQWEGVEVLDIVEAQLAHFKDLIGTRVLIDGPRARLTPGAAQGIGMALHELATNAVKYGALSTLEGSIKIAWGISGAAKPAFSMSWLEREGPKIVSPVGKGFGQIVIGRMAAAAVKGTADIDFGEMGLSWNLNAPAENALA